MNDITLIPVFFGAAFCSYYCRAIWRLYRAGPQGPSLGGTWRQHWCSRSVLRSALRCATHSLSVFLGLEIAEEARLPGSSTAESMEGGIDP